MSVSLIGSKSVQNELLPDMVNNKGSWNIDTSYSKNDSVISPNGYYAVAMVNNQGENPDTANPNPWNVAYGGGGGGGNQTLSFDDNTAELGISDGNVVNLSSLKSAQDWSLYRAKQMVDISFNTIVNVNGVLIYNPTTDNCFEYGVINATTPMPTSAFYLYRDRLPGQGNPVGDNGVIESHWYKQDLNPALNQDFCFRIVHQGSSSFLRTAWELPDGSVSPPIYTMGAMDIQGSPVSASVGSNGNGFQIRSDPNGWNNLFSDTNGYLYQQQSSNAGASWSSPNLIPIIQSGVSTPTAGNSGNITITMSNSYSSVNSYYVTATHIGTTAGANVAVNQTSANTFVIYWTNGGAGTQSFNWIAVGK